MPNIQPSSPLVAVIDTAEADLTATLQMLVSTDKVRIAGSARRIEDISRLLTADPDIVLLDIGSETHNMPELIRQIQDTSPKCQVILTGSREAPLDLLKAMQAGARGLLHKPLSARDTIDAIEQIYQSEQRRLQRIEEQAQARVTQGRAGEVITVFSPKGGVGCTVLATHISIALADLTKSRVALVDFDLQFGDVGVHLNLHSNHGIHELMRSLDDLDGAILDSVMVQHPSGIRVLLPPPTLNQVDEVETEGLVAVVKALRKHYDYVVVDMWHSIEDATLALMDISSVLLVVTTPEVPALRSTRRFLDYVRERPDRRAKVQLVVNRYPSKSAVDIKEIERSLGAAPAGMIPSDGRLVTGSVNEGVSFLSRRSEATDSMTQLARVLAEPRMARTRQSSAEQQQRAGGVIGRTADPHPL